MSRFVLVAVLLVCVFFNSAQERATVAAGTAMNHLAPDPTMSWWASLIRRLRRLLQQAHVPRKCAEHYCPNAGVGGGRNS
jgi:hypothetical protein